MKKHLFPALLLIGMISFVACPPPAAGNAPDPSSPLTPGDDYFVFVDVVNGTNGALGTRQAPVDDIMEGIGLADAAGKDVCVAAGTYNVDSTVAGGWIVLAEGVSLYGGYSADGNWTRNITLDTTTITDTASDNALTRAIECGSAITTATVVDGFTVNSGTGSGATAVYCLGSCTLSNNIINGFQGAPDASTTSYAVYIPGSSPVIQGNTLDGGNHSSSYGIYMYGTSTAVISDNTINGGGGQQFTDGIYCQQGSPHITGNTIGSGSGGTFGHCIQLSAGATPLVENNVFIADAAVANACVESTDADEPTSFINNGFGSGFNPLYLDFSSGSQHQCSNLAQVNALDENGYNPSGTVSGNYSIP